MAFVPKDQQTPNQRNSISNSIRSAVKGYGFNGAAIIDENGKETPITEAMIQKACKELDKQWCYPKNIRRQHLKSH